MEEEINCAIRACCNDPEKAIQALATILKEYSNGHKPEDYARCVLKYFALAPVEFVPVVQAIAKLARGNPHA